MFTQVVMFRKIVLSVVVSAILALSAACNPVPSADLSLKTSFIGHLGNDTDVTAGDIFDTEIIITNLGSQATSGIISVATNLPEGLSFLSSSNSTGWQCNAEGRVVTCFTFGSIPSHAYDIFQLQIDANPTLNGVYKVTSQLSYPGDTDLQNNNATVSANVLPLALVTQELDFQKAKNAGATFPVDVRNDPGCTRLGVGDWLDASWDQNADWTHGRHPGIVFMIDCGAHQGEAFIEAFHEFRLRNGWVVKSFNEDDFIVGDAAFNLDVAPQAGSCIPTFKAHVRSYGVTLRTTGDSGPINFPGSPPALRVAFNIIIEGPEGTDPYSGRFTCNE